MFILLIFTRPDNNASPHIKEQNYFDTVLNSTNKIIREQLCRINNNENATEGPPVTNKKFLFR